MAKALGIGVAQFRILKALAEKEDGTIMGLGGEEMQQALLANPEGVPPRYTDKRLKPPSAVALRSQAGQAIAGLVCRGLAEKHAAPSLHTGAAPLKAVVITQAGREMWAKIGTAEARADYRRNLRRAKTRRATVYIGWRKVKLAGGGFRYVYRHKTSGWSVFLQYHGTRKRWQWNIRREDGKETGWQDCACEASLQDAKKEAGGIFLTESQEAYNNRAAE